MRLGIIARFAPTIRSQRVVAGALIAICVFLFIGETRWMPVPFTFEAEVQTTAATRLQLLYDRGAGFNSRDATKLTIENRNTARKVRFPIRASSLKGFRLLQVDGAQPLRLRHLSVKTFGVGSTAIPSSAVTAANNVASITKAASGGVMITGEPGASEMTVELPLSSPLHATTKATWISWIVLLLLATASGAFLWIGANGAGIREPRRAVVIAILTLAFIAATALKLNGSSTALWRLLGDRQSPDAVVLAGSGQETRSDEWLVQTPWILSQLAAKPPLPLDNPNIGAPLTPLVTNLPARHWTMLFRPQMWGFFLFNAEHAFSLYWNFKWFALLLGAFLFLNLLTDGKSLLAFAGALFLFASPYIQWWFSSPTAMPEMVAMFFFALWAIAMIFRAPRKRTIVAASLALLFALLQFVFCCYPRFQVPLVYTGAVLLAFGCARGGSASGFRGFRLSCLAAALAITGLLLWFWYREVGELIHAVARLAYPGQIVSTGGDYPWFQLFAPFLEFSLNDQSYPAASMNVVEAAGFLFVAPILAAVAIRDAFRGRVDWVVIGCVVASAFLLLFMLVGIPVGVAKWSGWSQVYGTRAVLALGVVSTVGLFRYLAGRRLIAARRPGGELLAFTVAMFVSFLCLGRVNTALGDFVSVSVVAAAAVFFALVFICIWSRRVAASCALLIAPMLWANGLTNPISQGLPGITDNALRQRVAELHEKNPSAKWLVIGHSVRSQILAQLVKSTGAETLGGVRLTPDPEMMRVLDPDEKYASVVARYAIICFFPSPAAAVAEFELTFINWYVVHLPLQTELFDRLHVGYVLAVDLPETTGQIEGFEAIGEWEQCRLLARAAAK